MLHSSPSRFSTGVPVSAKRTRLFTRHTALYFCPEQHLAEIVRAADDAEKARITEALRVDLFELLLLDVRGRLKAHAEEHDDRAHYAPGIRSRAICQAVEHRRHLQHVQQRARDPDRALHAEGHGLAVLDLGFHFAVVGRAFPLAIAVVCAVILAVAAAAADEQHRQRRQQGDQLFHHDSPHQSFPES